MRTDDPGSAGDDSAGGDSTGGGEMWRIARRHSAGLVEGIARPAVDPGRK